MTDSTQKSQPPSRAELNSFYKVGDSCSFEQQIEAMLSVLQGKYHKGSNCIVNLADTYSLPCIDLDEDGRLRGIKNIFELPE